MKFIMSILLVGLSAVSCAQNRVSQTEFKKLIESKNMKEAMMANLYYETQEKRFNMIIEKLNKIVDDERI